MAELQHSNIPDEYLHEAKHAINAQTNSYLRAKGDGTTEFVPLSLDSFENQVELADDTTIITEFSYTPVAGRQYLFTLTKTDAGNVIFQNDMLDLRGTVVPTGANILLSFGGHVQYQSGQFKAVDSGYNFFRIVEVQ